MVRGFESRRFLQFAEHFGVAAAYLVEAQHGALFDF